MKKYFFILFSQIIVCQNIDINNNFFYENIRFQVLNNQIQSDYSFNIRPLNYVKLITENNFTYNVYKNIVSNKNEKLLIRFLGLDYFIEYNSKIPYKRNNGSMIPNRGYQHIISHGLFFRVGPLEITFKPEHMYSQNLDFDGFWEGHYPVIWAKRYILWNRVDIPERFGEIRHNQKLIGQSSIKLNWRNLSLGISNENIWWGPSRRNSIMMSNNAQGFKHISFNTNYPIKTFLGDFEWQIISGRLESSRYTPPRTDIEYGGQKLYIKKINQIGQPNDWRYLQGIIVSYSPKFIDGLSLGYIRWVQMYSSLVEGKYWWMKGSPTYFPVFKNLFRGKDQYENYEAQTDQAAGLFARWHWSDSKAEIYFEFYHNDSKQNIRDFILDSDHSRAFTIGLQKIFKVNNKNLLFNWEWTQMEQTAGRLLRDAFSWYQHGWVYHGYTNKGEVLGSAIGPGSNSHYFSLNKFSNSNKYGIGFEIIEHDNDFYHEAFASAQDFRRYWKDFNLHFDFHKSFKNLKLSTNLIYIRSLNYQWELDDLSAPYYHPGRDLDNFHLNLKLTYLGNW